MNAKEQRLGEQDIDRRIDEAQSERSEAKGTEKPAVTDEHKAQAQEMHKSYEDDRPTVALPGTGGTVSGTAVSDWIDDQDAQDAEGAKEE